MFRLGIRTDDEQSNVPFVSNRKIVGIPAFAMLLRGWYPPLAWISMICFPSTIVTLLTLIVCLAVFPLFLVSAKATMISITATIIDMIFAFMDMIILKIKDWWNDTDYD